MTASDCFLSLAVTLEPDSYLKGWAVATSGTKPLSEREQKFDGRKTRLDRPAKIAGDVVRSEARFSPSTSP